MSITVQKMHEVGEIITKTFYNNKKKKVACHKLKSYFPEIGKTLKRKGKTSVDLVRDIRET